MKQNDIRTFELQFMLARMLTFLLEILKETAVSAD